MAEALVWLGAGLSYLGGCLALMYLLRPRHTVESVAREIVEGLDKGTVVLPWTDEELNRAEREK